MALPLRELPAHQRPRERLLDLGAAALSDAELLAVLLGSGRVGASAVDLAHELLSEHGGVLGLAAARPEELARSNGVGPAKAARVLAGAALAVRLGGGGKPAAPIRTSADLAALVVPLLARERVERLIVVVLDGRHAVRRVETVAQGAVDRTPLPVREVLAMVLRHDGRAFGVAHNHPGGTTTASDADIAGTAILQAAAGQVGLRLADHLVVAGTGWASVIHSG